MKWVLSCSDGRISARFLRHGALCALAVPTNPHMPKLDHFARFGGHKQLQQDLAFQEGSAYTSSANAQDREQGLALCTCGSASVKPTSLQREGHGNLASLWGLRVEQVPL